MEGEVDEHLAAAVGEHQREALVAEDAFLEHMRPDASDQFGPHTCLGGISVIDDKADGVGGRPCALLADTLDKLLAHAIEQAPPVHVAVIHETVEHVLLAHEQATE